MFTSTYSPCPDSEKLAAIKISENFKFICHNIGQSLWPQGGEVHKRKLERLMRFFERLMPNNGNSEPLSSIILFSHSGTVMPKVITYPLLCYFHIPMLCSTALISALQLPARHVLKAFCSKLHTGLELSSLWLIYLHTASQFPSWNFSTSLVSPSSLLGFGFMSVLAFYFQSSGSPV